MDQRNRYAPAGQIIKLLPVPYVLNIVLLLIWPLLGSVSMTIYWILVLVLSRRLSSLAATLRDAMLSSSSTWLLLASIAGIGTTVLNGVIPIDTHFEEMNAILEGTADPELALQLVAPYIISAMASAIVTTPILIMAPAAFGLVGWIKFRSHVATIADVQRYVVNEGIQKQLVAHKLQLVMGLLLVGTVASIWGSFASIAAGGGGNGVAITSLLITAIVLGIGVAVTGIVSFFTLIAGYSKAGNALLLVESGRVMGDGSAPARGERAETRCAACGNSFQSRAGIKYCPVCGAAML